MAGTVFFSVTMSLDGFMAPEAVPAERRLLAREVSDDPGVQALGRRGGRNCRPGRSRSDSSGRC